MRTKRDFGQQFRMTIRKSLNGILIRWYTNFLRHVDSEEIAWLNKSVDRFYTYMVCIEEVRMGPFAHFNSEFSRPLRLRRFRANYVVLSIGLVPYRNHFHAQIQSGDASLELSFA